MSPLKDTKRHFSPLVCTIGTDGRFCQAKGHAKIDIDGLYGKGYRGVCSSLRKDKNE